MRQTTQQHVPHLRKFRPFPLRQEPLHVNNKRLNRPHMHLIPPLAPHPVPLPGDRQQRLVNCRPLGRQGPVGLEELQNGVREEKEEGYDRDDVGEHLAAYSLFPPFLSFPFLYLLSPSLPGLRRILVRRD